MPTYSRNEIIDILFILGEYYRIHRMISCLYLERFPKWIHHPSHSVIRLVEMRERRRVIIFDEYPLDVYVLPGHVYT